MWSIRGTWATFALSQIHSCSSQDSETSLGSMSLGSTSAWSTQPFAGITKIWCSIQSTITTGASRSCGTESQRTTEKDSKKLPNKKTSCFLKRIRIFCSILIQWSIQGIFTSKRLKSIKHCKCLESTFWPSLDPIMPASRLGSTLEKRWILFRDRGSISVSGAKKSIEGPARRFLWSLSTGSWSKIF